MLPCLNSSSCVVKAPCILMTGSSSKEHRFSSAVIQAVRTEREYLFTHCYNGLFSNLVQMTRSLNSERNLPKKCIYEASDFKYLNRFVCDCQDSSFRDLLQCIFCNKHGVKHNDMNTFLWILITFYTSCVCFYSHPTHLLNWSVVLISAYSEQSLDSFYSVILLELINP